MTRQADAAARQRLLERIVQYALRNGLASLSLRPLAKELGISAASLLYHFESKEKLTLEVLRSAGDGQRALFADLRTREHNSPKDVCRDIWRIVSAPEGWPIFRLFFETYGLALVDHDRFPGFFPAAITNWLGFISMPYLRAGFSEDEARVKASLFIAVFRGLLLDLCATGDRERVDQAFETWLESVE